MITAEPFECPACGTCRYQRVIFLGGEFSYTCPVCDAVHCFSESLFYRFQNTWEQRPEHRRYVGTWSKGSFLPGGPDEHDAERGLKRDCQPKFGALCDLRQSLLECGNPGVTPDVDVEQLSDKRPNGRFFVASGVHDHFQEALRGIFRIQDHLLNGAGEDTYNILIAYREGPLESILDNCARKLPGLDQVWRLPFKRSLRWPFDPASDRDIEGSLINIRVSDLLDGLEGTGEVISKRPGPCRQGKEVLKRLIEPLRDETLVTHLQTPLDRKYVAVLVHTDDSRRAGLRKPEQLLDSCRIVRDLGEFPVVLWLESQPPARSCLRQDLVFVHLPDVGLQAQFFRDHCKAVIGSNCSGCNIPALYDVPIVAFTKSRAYPDDFYCFGRLASAYDPDQSPWRGGLHKADNIVELKVEADQPTLPLLHRAEIEGWYRRHVPPTAVPQGYRELLGGFECACPNCANRNISRQFRLTRSDVCVPFECSKCGAGFVSYRGLTTASQVGVFETGRPTVHGRFGAAYLDLLEQSERAEPEMGQVSCEPQPVDNVRDGDWLAYYCMKPSIADLYYTLPSLLQMREKLPHHRLLAVIPKTYKRLLPLGYCEEIWTVDETPEKFHESSYSNNHALLEHLFQQKNIRGLTSNFPGKMPFGRNTYRFLATRLRPEPLPEKSLELALFCRLKQDRRWPDQPVFEALVNLLRARCWRFRFLVFPSSDGTDLPHWMASEEFVSVDPDIDAQLDMVAGSHVCVTPHGASEVISCIAGTPVIELETVPGTWRDPTPQPIRFGLDPDQYVRLEALSLNDIGPEVILETAARFF